MKLSLEILNYIWKCFKFEMAAGVEPHRTRATITPELLLLPARLLNYNTLPPLCHTSSGTLPPHHHHSYRFSYCNILYCEYRFVLFWSFASF